MSMTVVASVVGGMFARTGLAPRPVGGPHVVAEGVAIDYTLSPQCHRGDPRGMAVLESRCSMSHPDQYCRMKRGR